MAVERIRERREVHELGRLKLYRDDLEAIARVLAEFGTLHFTANNEVSGSEPGDFAKMRDELPERLENVEMDATRGESAVRVDLGTGSLVALIEPDMTARGVLTSIKEICDPHRVGRRRFLWASLVAAGGAAIFGGLITTDAMNKGAQFGEALLTATVPAGMAALAGAAVVLNQALFGQKDAHSRDVILNVPRAERPTFGQRLVADGGVSAFWTVVGLVCGGAIGYLVNQLPGL